MDIGHNLIPNSKKFTSVSRSKAFNTPPDVLATVVGYKKEPSMTKISSHKRQEFRFTSRDNLHSRAKVQMNA